MSGIRTDSLKRLLNLLIDAGAAYYYCDANSMAYFTLFMPLLGELTHKETGLIANDLTRTTRPYTRRAAQQTRFVLRFGEIINFERFDAAVHDVLSDLVGYEQLLPPEDDERAPPTTASYKMIFPIVSLDVWDQDPRHDQLREMSLLEISHAAYIVRSKERLLSPAERKRSHDRVMPEFRALVCEAEKLALRVVRVQSLLSEDAAEVHNEWLVTRGFPTLRPEWGTVSAKD